MSRRLISIFGIATFLIVLAACGGSDDSTSSDTSAPPPPAAAAPAAAPEIVGMRVDVNLEDPGESGKYRFDPDEFTFSNGDEVTFVLTSEGEFHTFTVNELDIDVAVDAKATESLTVKFDKPGSYELTCIPHGALGMKG